MMRMNKKLAPQIAASDSIRTTSTGLTVHSFLHGAESVAERLIDGNRKTSNEFAGRIPGPGAKLRFSCTRFTG
jgi:hypothetical protein